MSSFIAQGLRFGSVGFVGLLVNIAMVYLVKPMINLELSSVLAFLVAATVTWLLNRNFTFMETRVPEHNHAEIGLQWLVFVAVNAIGGTIYCVTFWYLTTHFSICREFPVIAVCAGGALGMMVNFTTSRSFVFAKRRGRSAFMIQ